MGANIKELREARRLALEEVAGKTGVTEIELERMTAPEDHLGQPIRWADTSPKGPRRAIDGARSVQSR